VIGDTGEEGMGPLVDLNLAQLLLANGKWILVGLFAVMAVWETIAPQRQLRLPTLRRWALHLLLYLGTNQAVRFTFGIGSVALAASVSGNPYGLLNRPSIPYLVRFVGAILAIDLLHYVTHRACHAFPWLWRAHVLHHSDPDFDFTLEFRFHPFETVFRWGAELVLIYLLAPPPFSVAVSEILVLASGFFTHANVRLPGRLERVLRWALITPELHRVHHSMDQRDQGRNLGAIFVWWDRWFGTYQNRVAGESDALKFGVEGVGAEESMRPLHFIAAPFRRQV
jgi:sterol desaturase/sphingolipid hydroxylase (fatty acid hydroxylase superfamily)